MVRKLIWVVSVLSMLFPVCAFGISGGEVPHDYWGDGSDGVQTGSFYCTPTGNLPCVKQFTTWTMSEGMPRTSTDSAFIVYASQSINLTGGTISMTNRGAVTNEGAGFVNYVNPLKSTLPGLAFDTAFLTKVGKVKGGDGGAGGNGGTGTAAEKAARSTGAAGGYGNMFGGGVGGGGGGGAAVNDVVVATLQQDADSPSQSGFDNISNGASGGVYYRSGDPKLLMGGTGGAGSANPGGAIYLISPSITLDSVTFDTRSTNDGGIGVIGLYNSGGGGNLDQGCGGGGGGGGGAGPIVLIYKTLSEASVTYTKNGGAAGAAGPMTSGCAGSGGDCCQTDAAAGTVGTNGTVYKFNVLTESLSTE